jgi:hypothetical protein
VDAEGARALARRIREERAQPAAPMQAQPPEPPAGSGFRIYWTERQRLHAGDRSAVFVRRFCKAQVEGEWVVTFLHEELVYVNDSSGSTHLDENFGAGRARRSHE